MTMIEPFLNTFTVTKDIGNSDLDPKVSSVVNEDFKCVVEMLVGKTFRHGLYRVYRGDQVVQATESVWNVFPKERNTCVAFGYDWLGRHLRYPFSSAARIQLIILSYPTWMFIWNYVHS